MRWCFRNRGGGPILGSNKELEITVQGLEDWVVHKDPCQLFSQMAIHDLGSS